MLGDSDIMKIALFHPWIKSQGGAEKLILEYAKNSRNKIDFYTWVYDKDKTFSEFKNFKVIELGPKFIRKLSRSYIGRGLFFISALFSKIPLKDYDVFLISTGGLAEAITLTNYKKNHTYTYVHTILRAAYKEDMNWNLKYRYNSFLKRYIYILAAWIYRFIEKLSWNKIDYAIFNSELSKSRAENHNLLNNIKSFIVYPGFDFVTSNNKNRFDNYFIYVARFGRAKRQDMLIKAWQKFVKKHSDYSLYLLGGIENKDYFDYLQNLAHKTKNVNFKVNVSNEEKFKLYENCCATIFPAFAEDFGIVPFEGLARGKPLIASEYGGYKELIKNCPGVLFFTEYKDINNTSIELYNSLELFINHKKEYLSKSNEILKYASNLNNDWKFFAKNMDKILK